MSSPNEVTDLSILSSGATTTSSTPYTDGVHSGHTSSGGPTATTAQRNAQSASPPATQMATKGKRKIKRKSGGNGGGGGANTPLMENGVVGIAPRSNSSGRIQVARLQGDAVIPDSPQQHQGLILSPDATPTHMAALPPAATATTAVIVTQPPLSSSSRRMAANNGSFVSAAGVGGHGTMAMVTPAGDGTAIVVPVDAQGRMHMRTASGGTGSSPRLSAVAPKSPPMDGGLELGASGRAPKRRDVMVTISPEADGHEMFGSGSGGAGLGSSTIVSGKGRAYQQGHGFNFNNQLVAGQRIKLVEDPNMYRPSTPILNWEGPKRSLKPPKLQLWLVITALVAFQMLMAGLVGYYLRDIATLFLAVWIPFFTILTGAIMFMSTTRHLQELTVLMQSINNPMDMDRVVEKLQHGRFSRFEEPWKVQVHIIKMFCRLLKHHHGVNPVTGTFINAGADHLFYGGGGGGGGANGGNGRGLVDDNDDEECEEEEEDDQYYTECEEDATAVQIGDEEDDVSAFNSLEQAPGFTSSPNRSAAARQKQQQRLVPPGLLHSPPEAQDWDFVYGTNEHPRLRRENTLEMTEHHHHHHQDDDDADWHTATESLDGNDHGEQEQMNDSLQLPRPLSATKMMGSGNSAHSGTRTVDVKSHSGSGGAYPPTNISHQLPHHHHRPAPQRGGPHNRSPDRHSTRTRSPERKSQGMRRSSSGHLLAAGNATNCGDLSPNHSRGPRDHSRSRRRSAAAGPARPSVDGDPLGDNNMEWSSVLGADNPPSNSIVLTLLKQVKPGQDLSKIVFPVHILESRSLLEKLSDLFIHPELFASIADHNDSVERLIAVSRWYISGFHMRPKGAKKPYNPILGETFECYFGKGTPHEVHYLAEQVSHHPPISIFIARHRASGTKITASYHPKSKLVSPNCGASLGEGNMLLEVPKCNARYKLNWPNVYVGGILTGPMKLEVVGDVVIEPENSDLVANLNFTRKPMFGGGYDDLKGGISRAKTKLFTLEGKWHGKTQLVPCVEKGAPPAEPVGLFDPEHHTAVRPFCDETTFPKPSRVIWKKVTIALRANEAVAAKNAKDEIESSERELRRAREARDEQYLPGFFRVVSDGASKDIKESKKQWSYIGDR